MSYVTKASLTLPLLMSALAMSQVTVPVAVAQEPDDDGARYLPPGPNRKQRRASQAIKRREQRRKS